MAKGNDIRKPDDQGEILGLDDFDYVDGFGPEHGSVGMDAADMHGNPVPNVDRSLGRSLSEYDENSGPGGASGMADDPGLGGSTGAADDTGMHIEPGFSIGYDTQGSMGIGPETGNEEVGAGYRTLADVADDIPSEELEG
jgi:hypothetical protein